MKNKIGYLLALGAGIGIGIVAAKLYFNRKQVDSEEEKAPEEKPENTQVETFEEVKAKMKPAVDIPPKKEYKDYENLTEKYKSKRRKEDKAMDEPYIISSEEFGTKNGYTYMYLNYYADDILTDDRDDPITDPESIVGSISLEEYFGSGPDEDLIYIRNDRLRCEYEITYDQRCYEDLNR